MPVARSGDICRRVFFLSVSRPAGRSFSAFQLSESNRLSFYAVFLWLCLPLCLHLPSYSSRLNLPNLTNLERSLDREMKNEKRRGKAETQLYLPVISCQQQRRLLYAALFFLLDILLVTAFAAQLVQRFRLLAYKRTCDRPFCRNLAQRRRRRLWYRKERECSSY